MKNAKRKAKTSRTRTLWRDRVRGTVRRRPIKAARRRSTFEYEVGSTSIVVRQLDEAAFTAYGFDRAAIKKFPLPALAFHFGLVEHGYELRLFEDGEYAGSRCRDFSGNHTIEDLKVSLVKAISDVVNAWRAGL